MPRAAYVFGILTLTTLLFFCACSIGEPTSESQGCVKDDECKGDRICEEGVCVDPDAEDGDSESEDETAEDETAIECSGPNCDELEEFCRYVVDEACDPPLADAVSMNTCIEKLMSYRDSGCLDGSNLMLCLAACAGRSKSCQYIEMCSQDCINNYCI